MNNIFDVLDDGDNDSNEIIQKNKTVNDWNVIKNKKNQKNEILSYKNAVNNKPYDSKNNKFNNKPNIIKKYNESYINQSTNAYNNKKKILCNNILTFNKCNYGDKCLYAHNYEEQNVDLFRKQLYDHVVSLDKWNIDLSKDTKYSQNLLIFTKICHDCEKRKCAGGYNCKYGVIDKKYQICHKDIESGNCDVINCQLIHLTKKGVLPINPIKKSYISKVLQTKSDLKKSIPIGNILNSDFFSLIAKKDTGNHDSDSDFDTKSIDEMQEFFDKNDDIDLCDKSIFIYK
jgi:hypothetical protein